jgi:hypothetical protein
MFRCLNATRWGGWLSFAHALSAERLPRILRGGTAIDHWQAFGKWTDDYLSSVALDGVVRDVYEQSSSGIFGPFFDPSRPMSVLQHVRPRHNYTKNTMGASTFLRRTHRRQRKLQKKQKRKRQQKQKTTPHNHVYLTTGLDTFSPVLERDVSPLHEFLVLNPQQTSVNLWVGSKNVTAPCHYDGYHNFFVQISGTKRFLLASPWARSWLRPFPFLHPSHAQCQRRLDTRSHQDGDTLPPHGDEFGFYEAVLEPGDLLYIPPGWFHEATSLSRSVSVNGWTPPRSEIETVEALFALPVPWEEEMRVPGESAPGENKPRKLVHILARLFGSATVPDAAAQFVKDLYAERYAELVAIGELDIGGPVSCITGRDAGGTGGTDPSIAAFVVRAQELAQLLPRDNKRTWLFNFCEVLAFSAVSAQTELVASLIHALPSCLREHAALELELERT